MSQRTPFQKTLLTITYSIIFITLCVAVMTLKTLRQTQQARNFSATPISVDYPAPPLTSYDMQAASHSLSEFSGEVVLLNFWATWCQPCLEEMPALESFYQTHKEDGFVIVGLNNGESTLEIDPYLSRVSVSFPIWLDTDLSGEAAFSVLNLPTSFLIDRNGRVRLEWLGAIELSTLEAVVTPIIQE